MIESNFLQMNTLGGRVLRSLLELLAIGSCHIWLVVGIKFASLVANLSFFLYILLHIFFLPPLEEALTLLECC